MIEFEELFIELSKKIINLSVDSIKFDRIYPGELITFSLFKGDKEKPKAYVKIVEVTSGHNKVWIEVGPSSPPVRFTLSDIEKAIEQLNLILS